MSLRAIYVRPPNDSKVSSNLSLKPMQVHCNILRSNLVKFATTITTTATAIKL